MTGNLQLIAAIVELLQKRLGGVVRDRLPDKQGSGVVEDAPEFVTFKVSQRDGACPLVTLTRLTVASRWKCVNVGMVLPDRPLLPMGFVIASRATIVGRSGRPRHEWLIVSRWGPRGSCLTVSRTLVSAAAAATAPSHLVPRWSAVALFDVRVAPFSTACFVFLDRCPAGLLLTGRFAPTRGCVRVELDGHSIRLQGNVDCVLRKSREDFQFNGASADWVGEFIEASS